MDLPGLGTTTGQWDLRATADDYLGRFDFAGKRVLDLGAASGFITFEIEWRGGSVVSFDIGDEQAWDVVPFADETRTRDELRQAFAVESRRLKNSYWLAHHLLSSKAQAFYGNVYDLPDTLGRFDAVVVAQILIHLRDPVAALASACRLSDDAVILTEGMLRLPLPLGLFHPNPHVPHRNHSWWRYSVGLYRRILGILGFEIESVQTMRHRCLSPGMKPWVKLTTIVARRRSGEKKNPLTGVRKWLAERF
jgi:SAM-dependent methyltransferase